MAANFDTLTYAKKLQEAGFTPQQAEAQAEALRAVVEENLATKRDISALQRDLKELENRLLVEIESLRQDTKRDLKELENRLFAEIEGLRQDTKRDIEALRLNMEHRFELVHKDIESVRKDIEVARRDTLIWLGGIMVAGISALGVLMKLL